MVVWRVSRSPSSARGTVCYMVMCQVWRGGWVSRYTPGQVEVDLLRDITSHELATRTFGAPAPAPLLGHHLALPRKPDTQPPPGLDDSLPTVTDPHLSFVVNFRSLYPTARMLMYI